MPYITPEMVAHAEFDVTNAHTASIVQGLGGLGGCPTMDEASHEVAKWFNRECSVAEIIFSAMDHICAVPYGRQPSLDMIAAGNKVLEWLMTVKMSEPIVRHNSALMSEIPLHLQPYMFSTESCNAHVYRKMREVGGLIAIATQDHSDVMAELAEKNRQIEIIEKAGQVRCYRTEYRPERRRNYRVKIAAQKSLLAIVSPESRASMHDYEAQQLAQWLQARAIEQRTAAIAAQIEDADDTLLRMVEALSVPSIAYDLERSKAHSIWKSIQGLQDALIKAGFPEPR